MKSMLGFWFFFFKSTIQTTYQKYQKYHLSSLLSVLWIQSTENNSADWIMSPKKESR